MLACHLSLVSLISLTGSRFAGTRVDVQVPLDLTEGAAFTQSSQGLAGADARRPIHQTAAGAAVLAVGADVAEWSVLLLSSAAA